MGPDTKIIYNKMSATMSLKSMVSNSENGVDKWEAFHNGPYLGELAKKGRLFSRTRVTW